MLKAYVGVTVLIICLGFLRLLGSVKLLLILAPHGACRAQTPPKGMIKPLGILLSPLLNDDFRGHLGMN